MQLDDTENFAEISPIVKLWAFRFLVELGGAKEFISDNCFSHQWIAKKLGFSEALLTDKFDEQVAFLRNSINYTKRFSNSIYSMLFT